MILMAVVLLLIIGLLLSARPTNFFYATSEELSNALFGWFKSMFQKMSGQQ